jgi:hypothetical protein
MKGLVYSPRFPRGSWWFYSLALGVVAILALLGWWALNIEPPVAAWALFAGSAVVAWLTLVRILRGLRVVPLVKGKATPGGYSLKSTYPVTMSAMDIAAKDGSRIIKSGSTVTVVERINRLGDDFYMGPALYVYEVLAAGGNFRFFSEVRLRSNDFDDLARALAVHEISLALLIETGPEAGHPPVHRVTPEAPYTRWIALPRRAGVISAVARDGADIPSMWREAASNSTDSVPITTRDHRPCVLTVAHVPPLHPEVWQVVGEGANGRYGDTIMLWTETGAVQCHVDVPGGFTSFALVTTIAENVQYFHVHLEGHQ